MLNPMASKQANEQASKQTSKQFPSKNTPSTCKQPQPAAGEAVSYPKKQPNFFLLLIVRQCCIKMACN